MTPKRYSASGRRQDDQRLRVGIDDDDIDVLGQSRLPLQTRRYTSDHRCLEPLGCNPLHQIVERFTTMIDLPSH
jgi:hypothetical protein